MFTKKLVSSATISSLVWFYFYVYLYPFLQFVKEILLHKEKTFNKIKGEGVFAVAKYFQELGK